MASNTIVFKYVRLPELDKIEGERMYYAFELRANNEVVGTVFALEVNNQPLPEIKELYVGTYTYEKRNPNVRKSFKLTRRKNG